MTLARLAGSAAGSHGHAQRRRSDRDGGVAGGPLGELRAVEADVGWGRGGRRDAAGVRGGSPDGERRGGDGRGGEAVRAGHVASPCRTVKRLSSRVTTPSWRRRTLWATMVSRCRRVSRRRAARESGTVTTSLCPE